MSISRFHKSIQPSSSHYCNDDEEAKRLIVHYFYDFLEIKNMYKKRFGIVLLNNLNNLNIDICGENVEYYKKISFELNKKIRNYNKSELDNRYYVEKEKRFSVDDTIYYEIVLSLANAYSSKFDRIVAFSKDKLVRHYAHDIKIDTVKIDLFNKKIPINIITGHKVAIRACEFNNLAKILGYSYNVERKLLEYKRLMNIIDENDINLANIVELEEDYYNNYLKQITEKSENHIISKILNNCRDICINNKPGSNVLKYLLLTMNNRILKKQYVDAQCAILSNLFLNYGCKVFDDMPYASSLIDHRISENELFEIIPTKDREHEFLSHKLEINAEQSAKIYSDKSDLIQFDNVDKLVNIFNSKVYKKQRSL